MESNDVAVDPSLLVDATADRRPRYDRYGEFSYFVSESFQNLVEESSSYRDDPTFSFYIGSLGTDRLTGFQELQETVTSFEPFSAEEINKEANIDYQGARDWFEREHPPAVDGKLADVLFDQFVFLFERSWVASRVKRSQNEVTDVPGLRRFVFDRDELEAVERQLPQEYQNKIRELKSGRRWKWVSLGLTVTGGFVGGPVGGAIFGAGLAQESLALIFDP